MSGREQMQQKYLRATNPIRFMGDEFIGILMPILR